MNTNDFLDIATAICPDRQLMIFEGKKWTFSQSSERIARLAGSLHEMGIKKGDRVGIVQVNCNQYLELYFAAAKLGAIFVAINFRAKADELSYMISNAGIKILFVGNRYLDMIQKILSDLSEMEKYVTLEEKVEGVLHYDDLLNGASPIEVNAEIEDDDITILMYTAGTTGRPKGVPLRHSGFVSYVLENVEPANPEIDERNLLTVPLYHVAGMQAMLAAVYGGRTLVMMKQFDTEEWMKIVQDEKATRAMLVPTMLKWVIDHSDFKKYDLSSLKVITYGAAPMPYEVIKKAIEEMPWVRFINAFGQTETASTITSLGPDDHIIEGTEKEKELKLKRLTSSIGRPLPDVEVKIVDKNMNILAAGEVGEILAKGPRVMTGYWGDEAKTREILDSEGWLRTGDQGWMDEEGYIYLAGRGDDMIIRGGENISPEEIENVLHSHPKIDEAAVIGIPDPEWGQEPRAIVVLKTGENLSEEDVMQYCRERLASFKRPRSVLFIDTLPRNQMGKVLKKELREKYGQA